MITQTLQDLLSQDPRRQSFQSQEYPKDLLFTKRVIFWINQMGSPSEDLLIAAWGHVVKRWEIPRKKYPEGSKGYHEYRYAQSKLSADVVDKILRTENFAEDRIKKIRSIMMNRDASPHPEGQVLEDALCLAFLELKFEGYIPEWGEEKYIDILKNTLKKMSSKAQQLALTIAYSEEGKKLLTKALTC